MRFLLLFSISISLFSAERIVSLAPATTEILFELGHFNEVVGVTDYCHYPLEAKNKVRLGGLYNLRYEDLIKIKPTLIIVDDSAGDRKKDIEKLKLRILTVKYKTITDIFYSIETIGNTLNEKSNSQKMVLTIKKQMANAFNLLKSKKVLWVIGESDKASGPGDFLVPGNNTFYNDLIEQLGGTNIFKSMQGYQNISHDVLKNKKFDLVIHLTQNKKNNYENFWKETYHIKPILLVDEKYYVPAIRFFDVIKEIEKNVKN